MFPLPRWVLGTAPVAAGMFLSIAAAEDAAGSESDKEGGMGLGMILVVAGLWILYVTRFPEPPSVWFAVGASAAGALTRWLGGRSQQAAALLATDSVTVGLLLIRATLKFWI